MATKWEFTKKTKAPIPKAMEYFSHPENIPKLHSDVVKSVTIKGREGDTITFEQQLELMRRKVTSLNKLTRNLGENKVVIDTIEGDGKGSKITMLLSSTSSGTEIKYVAEMELGPLGMFAKGPARSAMEKIADEDAKNLDVA